MSVPASVDELLSNKKPATTVVRIIVDTDLASEWHEIKEEVESLKFGEEKDLEYAKDRMEALRPLVDGATRTIKLKAIGRKPYDDLLGEHRPTPEAKKEARDEGQVDPPFNYDTFPAALLAACAVEPEFTLEQAQELFNSEAYNNAELNVLFMASLKVNSQSRIWSLGKELERTQS